MLQCYVHVCLRAYFFLAENSIEFMSHQRCPTLDRVRRLQKVTQPFYTRGQHRCCQRWNHVSVMTGRPWSSDPDKPFDHNRCSVLLYGARLSVVHRARHARMLVHVQFSVFDITSWKVNTSNKFTGCCPEQYVGIGVRGMGWGGWVEGGGVWVCVCVCVSGSLVECARVFPEVSWHNLSTEGQYFYWEKNPTQNVQIWTLSASTYAFFTKQTNEHSHFTKPNQQQIAR